MHVLVYYLCRFMAIIEQAVANLDTLDEDFAPVLIQLGARHPIRADFSADKAAAFVQSVLAIWSSVLQESMTSQSSAAWEALFDYFLTKLRQGYSKKLKQQKMAGNKQ